MNYQDELSEAIGSAKSVAKQKVKALVELDLDDVVDEFIDGLHDRAHRRLDELEHDGELNDNTFHSVMFDVVTEIFNVEADEFDYPEPKNISSGYNLYLDARDTIDEKVEGSGFTTVTDILTSGVDYAIRSIMIDYCNAAGDHINDNYVH